MATNIKTITPIETDLYRIVNIVRQLIEKANAANPTFLNILTYGGVADGVTDNTAAFTAALAALGPTGGTIYFPQGKYAFLSIQGINNYPSNGIFDVTLCGDGPDASVLFWPGTNSTFGMSVALNNTGTSTNNQSFHARDLSFTTSAAIAGVITGLTIQETGTNNGSYCALTSLYRVTFRADAQINDPSSGWAFCLNISNVSNINVIDCMFAGSSSPNGTGIQYAGTDATHIAVVLNCIGCTFNLLAVGIQIANAFTQGVDFVECNFTGCIVGFNIPNGVGTVNGASIAQVGFSNCQFGIFTGHNGIVGDPTTPIAVLQCSNCLFLTQDNAGGIVAPLLNSCIIGNVFQSSSTTNSTAISLAANASNVANIIEGNAFLNFGTGISLASGTNNVSIGPNLFFSNTVNINNSASAAKLNKGKWYSAQASGFATSIGNINLTAGAHATEILAGTTGTADAASIFIDFLSGDGGAVCGFIGRNDTSGVRGVSYNGNSLQITGATGTSATSNITGSRSGVATGIVGNVSGSAGDNGWVLRSGANGSADNTTVCLSFATGDNLNTAGSITRNDSAGTRHVSFNTSSDERLKKNIRPTKRGLDELRRLEVIDYGPEGDSAQAFVAQRCVDIYPEAVHVGGDDLQKDPWQMDYGRMTPLLVRAVQQLSERVEWLEGKVSSSLH